MPDRSAAGSPDVDAVVIGAGFAGLYMIHRLRAAGLGVRAFEAGSGVGGTWYWNRYPGARCDSESIHYSYSFDSALEQEWTWSERFATQAEILRYLDHVADRFDLRRSITFDAPVARCIFDEARSLWAIETARGERTTARFLITAVGNMSQPRAPDLPGLSDFAGDVYHTGYWPHEPVAFAGKRVGLFGTGSSGVQSIPVIAQEAGHLTVFQRTPCFTVPARNAPLSAERVAEVKASYGRLRAEARAHPAGIPMSGTDRSALEFTIEERERIYAEKWAEGGAGFAAAFTDLMIDEAANETAADFIRARIREIVADPAVAERLTPRSFPFGAKRLCVDTDYYAAFNQPNVNLVDLRETPVDRVGPAGIWAGEQEYPLDAIVFATGFDAVTGALLDIDIQGADGRTLRNEWRAGPRTYLGLATHGFPNLFMIGGPGSPTPLANQPTVIEHHVELIATYLEVLGKAGFDHVEAERAAQDDWTAQVNAAVSGTLFDRADSWYLGANIPGKPRSFMPYAGGVGRYREICDEMAAAGHAGFAVRRAAP